MEAQNQAIDKLNKCFRDKLASLLTDVFNPPFIVMLSLGAIAHATTARTSDFVKFWALSSLFVGVIPIAITLRGLSKGWIADRHITMARQRTKPFLVLSASTVVCSIALIAMEAPPEIVAAVLSSLVVILLGLALTPRFKFSMHCGSIAGSATAVTLLFGSVWAMPFILLVPIIGWARVEIAHHTVSQVIMGSLIGSGVAGFIFAVVT